MLKKNTNKETGQKGEKIACEYLIKNNYDILETNKRFSKFCEIDIIAKDRDTLVFVEVKTRKSNFCGSPLEAITKSKFNHIKMGLFTYLQESNIKYKKFRIDAISVILNPTININHLKNVSI